MAPAGLDRVDHSSIHHRVRPRAQYGVLADDQVEGAPDRIGAWCRSEEVAVHVESIVVVLAAVGGNRTGPVLWSAQGEKAALTEAGLGRRGAVRPGQGSRLVAVDGHPGPERGQQVISWQP